MEAGGFNSGVRRVARTHPAGVLALLAALLLAGCGGGGLSLEAGPAAAPGASGSRHLERGVIPGAVDSKDIAQAAAELDSTPVPAGVDAGVWADLRGALRGALLSRGASKVASGAPQSAASQVTQFTPLAADNAVRFAWTEANQGDYDHNGIVNVQDLSQVGLHFGAASSDEDWLAARCADGNGDGLVNVQDVTPIGGNFLSAIAGYNVYRAVDMGSAPELVGSLPRTAAMEANAQTTLYDFSDMNLPEGASTLVYEVRPFAPGTQEEGLASFPFEVHPGAAFGEHLQPASQEFVDEDGTQAAVLSGELLLNYGAQPSADELFGLVYQDLNAELLGQIPGSLSYRIGFAGSQQDIPSLKNAAEAAAAGACTVDYDYLTAPDGNASDARSVSMTYSDPRRSELWGLDMVNADDAWDISQGAGVVVAVIDTGVRTDHEDLAGQTVDGARFGGSEPWDQDSVGHGTHVAGTIAAAGDNGVGIVGLAPQALIMPLRAGSVISGQWLFPSSDLTASINFAVDNGARVINMSLGGQGSTMGSSFEAALANAESNGVVVCVAAGNSNADAGGFVPARYSSVLCVGSVGPSKARASYSNYGSVVDVCAPGGDIQTAYSQGILSSVPTTTSSYSFYQGTSMACPHASAFCALLLGANPSLTPADVRDRAKSTGQVIGASTSIGPLIDAYAALSSLDSFSVSGNVARADSLGISNVTLTLSDGVNEYSTTTASGGVYSVGGVPAGTYTVTPLRAGWSFEPESQDVTIDGASVTDVDFVAAQVGIFETENNDTPAQANELPAFPFTASDWGGSLGSGTDYVATDGDGTDIFKFTIDQPSRVYFTLGFDGGRGNLDLKLFGTNGTTLLASSLTKTGSSEKIACSLTAAGTYYISCLKTSGCSDYTLEGDALPIYAVRGTVLNSQGAGVANVMLTLKGETETFTAKTVANGTYTITGVPDGDYALTPALTPRSFLPGKLDVSVAGGDLEAQDFTAIGPFTVGGKITVTGTTTAIAGAKLTLAGEGRSYSATSAANGTYTITNVMAGLYHLSCSASGRTFTPDGADVEVIDSNITGQDFSGLGPFTVGGSITQNSTGVSGVTLSLVGGGKTYTAKSITGGAFTVTGVPKGVYKLTPSMSGRTFTPESLDVTVADSNVTGQAFTAIGPFSVSGSVSNSVGGAALSAVKLTLSGTRGTFTATTTAAGTFTIANVPNGSYTLTPSRTGYSFTPASRSVTVDGASVTSQSFSGKAVFSVAGRIMKGSAGLAGISVELKGDNGTFLATTNSTGNFTLTGVPAGSYTLTPTTGGHTYTPANRSVTVVNANITAMNFSST